MENRDITTRETCSDSCSRTLSISGPPAVQTYLYLTEGLSPILTTTCSCPSPSSIVDPIQSIRPLGDLHCSLVQISRGTNVILG